MHYSSSRLSRLALGAVLALGLTTSSGCGYTVVQYKNAIPGAQTLAIEALSNGSFEPGVETVVLDALRREAIERDGLRLVEDPETADLVIGGAVKSLNINARSFTSVVLAAEYEVAMNLSLTARRSDGTLIPIDPRAQHQRDRYLASADLEAMRKNRREAIHRLASVLADRVYDSLYESAAPGATTETATP